MNDSFKRKINGIYGWKTKDGMVVPPKHEFPKEVKERADYFWEMAEDGLTLMGAMECIFSSEKPEEYDLVATKDWLPKTKEFNEWVGFQQPMAESEMVVYLLYGQGEADDGD